MAKDPSTFDLNLSDSSASTSSCIEIDINGTKYCAYGGSKNKVLSVPCLLDQSMTVYLTNSKKQTTSTPAQLSFVLSGSSMTPSFTANSSWKVVDSGNDSIYVTYNSDPKMFFVVPKSIPYPPPAGIGIVIVGTTEDGDHDPE